MKIGKIICIVSLVLVLYVPSVFSRCDTMNGPVIKAARQALETKNADLVLIWVEKKDEEAVRKAFREALENRKSQPQNRQSDLPFFETVVRIHRQGEGVDYTGLKADEVGVSPEVMAADQALETGSADQLVSDTLSEVNSGIRKRFDKAMEKSRHRNENLDAGREYVKAYVEFMHYVEKISDDVSEGNILSEKAHQKEVNDREQ